MKLLRKPLEPRTIATARWVAAGVGVFLLVALQVGGFGQLRLFGVYPEMLVVVVCSAALHRGPVVGGLFGFVLGFAKDLPGGHLVGLSGIGYAAAGALAGVLGARVFPDRWPVIAAAVAVGTAASQIVYTAGASAFGFSLPFWEIGPGVVGGLLAYHLLLTPFLYPLTRWLTELLLPGGLDT